MPPAEICEGIPPSLLWSFYCLPLAKDDILTITGTTGGGRQPTGARNAPSRGGHLGIVCFFFLMMQCFPILNEVIFCTMFQKIKNHRANDVHRPPLALRKLVLMIVQFVRN